MTHGDGVLMTVLFLFHMRSSLVAAITLPIGVVLPFIPMCLMGITANIMSLAGIIIAIGDMMDSAVVLVENTHRKLERILVGMIALLGIATETASIMMVYLDQSYETWRKEGRIRSVADLIDMAVESATLRARPLVMTVGMNIVGLIPVMVDTGVGSDVDKRVAAPLWGGLISLTILTLAVIPAFYVIWRGFQLRRALPGSPSVSEEAIPESA